MKRGIWEKRMPTTIAFLLILISILTTSYLLKDRVLTIGKASSDTTPINIQIANITDNSFSVFFTTKKESVSALDLTGKDILSTVVYDIRDTGRKQASYYSHFITVDNLKPQTIYTFSIISEGETFLDQGDKKFEVVTGPTIPPPQEKFSSGKILLPDGSPANDTIVYITVSGSATIATITNSSGMFLLPRALRNTTLDDYVNLNSADLNIIAIRQNMSSSVKMRFNDSYSIPTITLLQNYNFTPQASIQEQIFGPQLVIPKTQVKTNEIKILSPVENESFVDQRPKFSGTALPNQKIKIIIESRHQIEAEATADKNGVWSFRPNTSLSPGIHKITIESKDSFGIIKRITKSFNIFAAGSQVFQTATPSATPTLRITPTSTPTIAIALSPTLSPTLAVTLAPSPSPTIQPPPPTISPPGNTISAIALTFLSLLFIATGATIFFLMA